MKILKEGCHDMKEFVFDSEYEKRLYKRLNQLLCGSGLSVKSMSRIISVSEDVIEAWIAGKRYPMAKYLGKIAEMCNVSVEYLVCRTNNSARITDEEIRCRFYGKQYRPYVKNDMIDLSLFDEEETARILELCDSMKSGGNV